MRKTRSSAVLASYRIYATRIRDPPLLFA